MQFLWLSQAFAQPANNGEATNVKGLGVPRFSPDFSLPVFALRPN